MFIYIHITYGIGETNCFKYRKKSFFQLIICYLISEKVSVIVQTYKLLAIYINHIATCEFLYENIEAINKNMKFNKRVRCYKSIIKYLSLMKQQIFFLLTYGRQHDYDCLNKSNFVFLTK